jgi:hypothetical protein
MTKRSKYEQAQRAAEDERMRAIDAAWNAKLSPAERSSFAAAVAEAVQRPKEPPVDMAPGTKPNPPRPGREPKPKDEPRRSRY